MDAMNEIAFNLAADTTKQLITFSTAIITLTATFAKDTFLVGQKKFPRALATSWVLHLCCIAFSIWTLQAITGALANGCPDVKCLWEFAVSLPASLMFLTFYAAIISTVVAGWKSVKSILAGTSTADAGNRT
jgi:hypothetical protein